MRTNLGLIGIIIGSVAIGIAVFQNNLRASPLLASQEPTLKKLAMDASK